MDHVRRLGNLISIPIKPDENGFTGRECPQPDCEGYFKVQFGTGLKDEGIPCHCPYCGHTAGHDQFWTKEQIEYAESVALRKVTDAIHEDFKKLEFDHRPTGAFGIGISLKVTKDRPTPIRYYREKQLETEIICVNCTLRYSVYGVFAFCPDCGQHNSIQILDKNLELVSKMLDMASVADVELAEWLTNNALEDCVSVFDGFGREICRVHAKKATDPAKAEKVSFQNLQGAKESLAGLFNLNIAAGLTAEEWSAIVQGFQKRHLLSHKLGIIDEDYARKSGDTRAVVGRKIRIEAGEVKELVRIVSKLARNLYDDLQNGGKTA
ncbi:MAG: hypothetical protein JXA30_15060 [Deltaproteobacteria bacterium]|nr:hypothetical protein [Deltaproteobacteria bacterium]